MTQNKSKKDKSTKDKKDRLPKSFSMSYRSRILFYRNLAALISSGIDIKSGLRILWQQKLPKNIRSAIKQLSKGVQKGSSIQESLNKSGSFFSPFEVEIIGLGEKSGTLDINLHMLANHYEKLLDSRNKLFSALLFPFIYIHLFVVSAPSLNLLFHPKYFMADFIREVGGFLIVFYGIPFLLWKFANIPAVKKPLHKHLPRFPIIGPYIKRRDISMFLRGIKCMYGAGMGLPESIKTGASLCKNNYIRSLCLLLAQRTESGFPMAHTLPGINLLDPLATSMIATGEASGTLDTMLEKAVEYYEEKQAMFLNKFISIFPILLYLVMILYCAKTIIGGFVDQQAEMIKFLE